MPKVVESESHVEELTVDHGKRALVTNAFDRIRLLFNVLVAFSSPEESASKTGIQWLALKGEKDKITKAKEYIKSLCNPEINISVPFSEELYAVIYPFRDELERSTGAVVNFPSSSECTVQGSQEAVIMAQSVIEDKLCNINTSSRTSARRDIDPSLREFALKLGYSKQVIDQAVRKLGPDATQNTLLSELLKTTASMPYQLSAPQPKPMPAPTAPYPRRDTRDIIPRGAPTAQPVMARAGYDNPADIYTERGTAHAGMPHRRDIRDSSGQPPMFRSGYENPRDAIPNGSQPAMVRPGYDTPSDVLERGASRGTKRVYERSGDIAVRGSSSAMRPPMQGPGYGAHVQPTHDAYHVAAGSGVNDRGLPDRQEEQYVYQQLQDVKETLGDAASSDLRPVVVDGSNVAMSHGRQEIFSCKGIQLCVDYFRKRGHKEITVFVPLWRKEASRPEKPITDQDILYNLERERVLVFTPSRKVNGRRIVCYDDRFIIKLAAETDGVVVSNDNFRDLTKESPKWRDTIEQRLLMYSFVMDMFMIPDDPLGKHGPNLDEFLRKGSATHPRICPYLKKCTYGLKCRFYHPERDQERAESSRKLQELRGIFGESVSDAVMIRVVNENPGANVTLLANRLCDMGHGLGGKH